MRTFINHRLHGEDHAFLQADSLPGYTHMLVVRLFMQGAANAVSQQIPHNRETTLLRMLLNGGHHIPQPVARNSLFNAQIQTLPSDPHQLLGRFTYLTNFITPSRITEPAVTLHHDINLGNIAFLQWRPAREAMGDHIIDGSTGLRRESIIPFSELLPSQLNNMISHKIINLQSSDPRCDQLRDFTVAVGHNFTGLSHSLNFLT
ncbi:hypothetical protein D3C81_1476230 [compost metagenome]